MKMKKLLALLLAVVFVGAAFVGCSSSDDDDEDKGAVVQTYLASVPTSIDPSAFYSSADTIKLMGLLYEGLTTIDEDGKVQEALAEDWEFEVDERDGYLKLEIELGSSRWSDGIIVDADDFIYAWTRILLPENNNSNAALLYPILNAKKVKEGLCSVNDLGVEAIKDDVIQITFEKDFTDEDYFLRVLASPALVPLREEIVSDEGWDRVNCPSYVTNGPFRIRRWASSALELERSIYYKCVSDKDGADDKVVKPYQIMILYGEGETPDEQYPRYEATSEDILPENKLFYLSLNGASKELYNKVKDDVETSDLLSTYCLFFDVTNPLFEDARVRRALSLAIDRNELANLDSVGGYVKPATGFIPTGVEDESRKDDFREEGGELISASSNMAEAKKILAETGIPKGTISLEVSSARPFEKDVANYMARTWKELGFDVEILDRVRKPEYIYSKANGTYEISMNDANVIATDMQSMTADAYSMLMAFSSEFGGHFIDVTTGDDVIYNKHFTGFADEKYDELCEKILKAKDTEARTAAMHKAEEYLMEQMPVVPLFFNQDAYISQDLSKINYDKFGRLDLSKLKQDDYEDYLPVEDEE